MLCLTYICYKFRKVSRQEGLPELKKDKGNEDGKKSVDEALVDGEYVVVDSADKLTKNKKSVVHRVTRHSVIPMRMASGELAFSTAHA